MSMGKPTLLQIVIGASRTPLSATTMFVNVLMIQNNAANQCRVGDNTVTASKGVALAPASGVPGGSVTVPPLVVTNTDLADWYVAGTQGDVIDVLYL